MRSKALKAILLGKLVGRLTQPEAKAALAAAMGQAAASGLTAEEMQKRLHGPMTGQNQEPQADQIMAALGELTEEQVRALPPQLAQAILQRYRPEALSGATPSPSSPASDSAV